MNKITLGTITVVASATAVIGFMTKNKIDGLQGNLRTTKTELASTQRTLGDTKQTLARTTDDLASANKSLAEEKSKLETTVAERDDLTKKLADQDTKLKEKEEKLIVLEKQIADLGSTKAGGTEDLAGKIKQLSEEHDQLAAQVDTLKQEKDGLTAKLETSEKALTTANERVVHYEKNIAKTGLTGRVVAVNPGWNFVVLDIGDKNGAAVNAPIVVSRNGQNIARARIKTVEPGMSVADIIPESLSRGEAVQPGDQVVFTRS